MSRIEPRPGQDALFPSDSVAGTGHGSFHKRYQRRAAHYPHTVGAVSGHEQAFAVATLTLEHQSPTAGP